MTDKHPVEVFFFEGIEDFNNKKLDKYLTQFADDIEMYTFQGWLRGKEAITKRFSSLFNEYPELLMEINRFQLREVASNTVIVDFEASTFQSPGAKPFITTGSGVYVNREGKWVEVFEHETTYI